MATSDLPEPPHAPSPASSKIKVKTTWPTWPPNTDRKPIRTERLLIRPFDASDASAMYELRTQPEVMTWTALGQVDKDAEQSRAFVERFLPPKDHETYNFVVVYLGESSDDKNGVVIGCGGCHILRPELGWPEMGYMFRKEYWNKGLATEFIRAFLKAWWALPRSHVELEVDAASVKEKKDGVAEVPEAVTALIEAGNMGSRRVLEKNGFKEYKTWNEPDSRVGFEGAEATLVKFSLEAPES
ncbi:acetyltransferase domain-containing protein [Xylariaceae sp. AK1471]|nr:acetyltransferase domain-containing protein [Xylariaceae sp. AK1471]